MTQEDREVMAGFAAALKQVATKDNWSSRIGDMLKIGAIIWGAATISSDVKVLQRDYQTVNAELKSLVTAYSQHVGWSAGKTGEIEERLNAIEGSRRRVR